MLNVIVTAKEIYELPFAYNVSFDEKCNETLSQSRNEG